MSKKSKQKYYFIETYGCSLNQSDSEAMEGILNKHGFLATTEIEKADVVIENTCTVKFPTHTNFEKRINELRILNKPVIITGCIPSVDTSKYKDFSLLGTDQISHIFEAVEQTLAGNKVQIVKKENNERLNLPKVKKNDIIEILPISKGCLGNCTYCQTKIARGKLFSYDENIIVARAKNAIADGAKEIWLTSQDCGAYGQDIGTSIVNLLQKLIRIEGDFKIRLGMSNPNFVAKYLDELVNIFKSEKMFKFLHIPIQAGSDNVLKSMNRFYKMSAVDKIITKFKAEIKDITIATDIIVGFPTETELDFKKTMDIIEKYRFPVINSSRFWKMKFTEAEKMKQLDTKVIKDRSKILNDRKNEIFREVNQNWISCEFDIVIFEYNPEKNQSLGHNYAYKQVIVDGKYDLGQKLKVRITKTTTWDLRGEVL